MRGTSCSGASTRSKSSNWESSRTSEQPGCTASSKAAPSSRSSATRTRPRCSHAPVRSSHSHPCSSHGSRGAITPSASPRSTVATPQRRWSTSSVPTGATTPPAGGPPLSRHSPTGIEALIALGRLAEADARIADYERRCSPERHARGLARTAQCRGLIASLRGDHGERKRSSRGRSTSRNMRRARTSGHARSWPSPPRGGDTGVAGTPAAPSRRRSSCSSARAPSSGQTGRVPTSPPSGSSAGRPMS